MNLGTNGKHNYLPIYLIFISEIAIFPFKIGRDFHTNEYTHFCDNVDNSRSLL